MTTSTQSADSLGLAELNSAFEASDPEKVVRWANAQFSDDLIMTSSFGADSAVLLHMASLAKPDIRVIMVDTGFLFPETFQHMEDLRRRLSLNVWVYRTRKDPIEYLEEIGEEDPRYRHNRDACCAVNKNEPIERAMSEMKPRAWLRGIRRNQTAERKKAHFVEWSQRFNCYAISPLLNWSTRDIFRYMKKHELPHHPLYSQGFVSIGCNPLSCTRAVQPGEDDRAGRWSDSAKSECGINFTSGMDSSISTPPASNE